MTPAPTAYRVARNPAGALRWWAPGEPIPAGHIEARDAMAEEAALMERIAEHKNPPVTWGERVRAMMERNHPTAGATA